jgi:hypothetical protein
MARFDLGCIVATPGALEAMEANQTSPYEFLRRHSAGDWGELEREDKAENDWALVRGLRILSAYSMPDLTRIWVITEADRSATTILLPEEY